MKGKDNIQINPRRWNGIIVIIKPIITPKTNLTKFVLISRKKHTRGE